MESNKLTSMIATKIAEHQRSISDWEKAKVVAQQIPEEISNCCDWYTLRELSSIENRWHLETHFISEEQADKIIRLLKLTGVVEVTSSFNKYSNTWRYRGSFVAGDYEVDVLVDGGSKPPQCRVEEIREVKEVVTYKAICEETGEEV